MSTRVIRFNPQNTKRLENTIGEYDDINEFIGKLFDAYDEKQIRGSYLPDQYNQEPV